VIEILNNLKKPGSAPRRILYAAELGETKSHLASFRRIAIRLNAQGHQCVFALGNVAFKQKKEAAIRRFILFGRFRQGSFSKPANAEARKR
jgi:hypothetical protein